MKKQRLKQIPESKAKNKTKKIEIKTGRIVPLPFISFVLKFDALSKDAFSATVAAKRVESCSQ